MKKMKRWKSLLFTVVGILGIAFLLNKETLNIKAKTEPVVAKGVYVEGIDLSGMTKAQARTTIENYVYQRQ